MPVFGMLSLLAGIVLFVFTNIHAPEDAFPGVRWVYKPEFYYSFIIISLGFVFYGLYEIATELRSTGKRRRTSTPIIDPPKTCSSCQEILSFMARFCPHCGRAVHRSDESSCPRCGYIGSAGARFCELCGHVMTSPAPGAVGAVCTSSSPAGAQGVWFFLSRCYCHRIGSCHFSGDGVMCLVAICSPPNLVGEKAR